MKPFSGDVNFCFALRLLTESIHIKEWRNHMKVESAAKRVLQIKERGIVQLSETPHKYFHEKSTFFLHYVYMCVCCVVQLYIACRIISYHMLSQPLYYCI